MTTGWCGRVIKLLLTTTAVAYQRQQIQELSAQSSGKQKELSGIQSILQTSLYLDEDWSKFKRHSWPGPHASS